MVQHHQYQLSNTLYRKIYRQSRKEFPKSKWNGTLHNAAGVCETLKNELLQQYLK